MKNFIKDVSAIAKSRRACIAITLFIYILLSCYCRSAFAGAEHTLYGKVLSPKGDPLAGATVRINLSDKHTLRTDNSGRFVWSNAEWPASVIEAEHPTYPGYKAITLVDPREEETFALLVLKRTIDFQGRVTDLQKRGIAKAKLCLECAGGMTASGFAMQHRIETDNEGNFVLKGLVPNYPYHLAVYAKGYVRIVSEPFIASRMWPISSSMQKLAWVKMERGNRVTFLILDPEGKPIDGAHVIVGGKDWAFSSSNTNIDGRAVLTDLPLGRVHVSVHTKEGYRQSSHYFVVRKEEPVRIELVEKPG